MTAPIRPAGQEDLPVLAALMGEYYAEAGYTLRADAAERAFAPLLDEPRLGRVWLIETADVPVGYVVLTLAYSMEYGGPRGFLDDFYVRPAVRGKGLGTIALAATCEACRQLGVRALLVEAGPDGHPARTLYARAGFRENGRVFLSFPLAAPVHEA